MFLSKLSLNLLLKALILLSILISVQVLIYHGLVNAVQSLRKSAEKISQQVYITI